MIEDKIRYWAARHSVAEKLAENKPFTTRVQLRNALVAYMEPLLPTRFNSDKQATVTLAEKLAFVPLVKSGWGPSEDEIEAVAKDMVDCYLAHAQAFAQKGFQEPAQAALNSLSDFEFSV